MKKEICWLISNVTAGNSAQIQSVIDSGMVPHLVEAMRSGDSKTRKEAAWAVSNFASGATVTQLQFLAENHTIQPLISLLAAKTADIKTLQICLDCLACILRAGEMEDGSNPCVTYTEV